MCRSLLLALCCIGSVQSLTIKADGDAKPVWASDLVKAKVESDKIQGMIAEPEKGIRPGFLRYPTTPVGWEVKTDQSTGVTYFYNPETRISTTRRPEMDGSDISSTLKDFRRVSALRTEKP